MAWADTVLWCVVAKCITIVALGITSIIYACIKECVNKKADTEKEIKKMEQEQFNNLLEKLYP